MKTETQIRTLLEKYFEAQTSLDEERELREFFAAHPSPENEELSGMFAFFDRQARVEAPGNFRPHRRTLRRISIAVASAAVIALCVTFLVHRNPPLPEAYACIDGVVVTDPEVIIAEFNRLTRTHAMSKANHAVGKLHSISKVEQTLSKISAPIEAIKK